MEFAQHHASFKQDMDKKSLTTPTSQYREFVRYNTLSEDSISAVTGLRAIFIIIAIRRAVVG
ncbi:hypothetical protein F4167_16090 [Candidatus Poribacteria bacterium]|nr:hypothetical protein [Candidatus Poribacteria bacterium]